MDLIDTHCHLDVSEFDADRSDVIGRARAAGVKAFVVPAVDAAGWPFLQSLCAETADLYPALGLHPVYLDQHRDADIKTLERLVADTRPCAIGEIGLDFFVRYLDRDRQAEVFAAQLSVAAAADLPVLLHVRKAHDQVLGMLRRQPVRGGIVHAFNGSLQQAQKFIDLGFKLGFGGMLTYARSTKLRALAKTLPEHALVLETDAPDMSVAAHHGERNSPEYLPDCLQALAEVREESPEHMARVTGANARAVLGLH